MKVITKELPKSQIEFTVELDAQEFGAYLQKGADAVSREIKVDGFRSGKVPYDVLKAKIGEMTILEEAARQAVNKTADEAIKENVGGHEPFGRPQISITKLAPGNPLEYKIVIAVLPAITLPDLHLAKVKSEPAEVKEEAVEKLVENLREMRVKETIAEREAGEGDKAIVDLEMFLDNVPVESGQGKGTAVIIGKNYIVPGFDKNLIGMKKGDTREFKIHYPEDHFMKNLAGKLVEFKVKLVEVYSRELPAVDEAFASQFGLKTAAEFEDNIRKSLKMEQREKAEQRVEIEMLDKLIAATKFGDIPEMLIENEADSMLHELEHDVERRGGKFDDYLASLKKSRNQLMLDILPDAVKRVKSALLIREIGRQEKIEVSEQEVDQKVEELLRQYKGYEKVEERVRSHSYRHYLKDTIANKKVMDRLKEWNVEK